MYAFLSKDGSAATASAAWATTMWLRMYSPTVLTMLSTMNSTTMSLM